jgi:hypothetical protein
MILREMNPDGEHAYLKFQVGEMVTRTMTQPIYDLGRCVSPKTLRGVATVFFLRGWGVTAAAWKMAEGKV